jgi:2-keto-4-pentenoate hydratase/2-oxohepta-3-ene-1,7-dioic acid hydratase in catechol pathway
MRICRTTDGRIGLAAANGRIVDVSSVVAARLGLHGYPLPTHDLLIAGLDELRDDLDHAVRQAGSLIEAGAALASPVANPGKLVAAPVNYAKHLQEVRDQAELHHGNQAHMRQIREIGLFLKASSSLIGPGEAVRLPFTDRRIDHEIELAVAIGRTARDVSAANALGYVAGYAIGLDMTVRGPEDRSFRKSLDTFSVLGPWLVTADELPDPGGLDLELKVNGETRQKANTRDLVLGVPELIEYASSFYTLYPGDVIFTGTPEGVGPVRPGDRIEASIDRIGTMTVAVEAVQDAREPAHA